MLADRPGFESMSPWAPELLFLHLHLCPFVILRSNAVTRVQSPASGRAHVPHPGNNSLSPPTLSKPVFLPLSKHALNFPALVPMLIDTKASPGPPSTCPPGLWQPCLWSPDLHKCPLSPSLKSSSAPPGLCLVLLCVCV